MFLIDFLNRLQMLKLDIYSKSTKTNSVLHSMQYEVHSRSHNLKKNIVLNLFSHCEVRTLHSPDNASRNTTVNFHTQLQHQKVIRPSSVTAAKCLSKMWKTAAASSPSSKSFSSHEHETVQWRKSLILDWFATFSAIRAVA